VQAKNIKKFRSENPQFKHLTSEQILQIFKVYKQCIERNFDPSDITILVSGTLIILISCLFMNGGAGQEIASISRTNSPNNIVMNTVIASATSGLTMMMMN